MNNKIYYNPTQKIPTTQKKSQKKLLPELTNQTSNRRLSDNIKLTSPRPPHIPQNQEVISPQNKTFKNKKIDTIKKDVKNTSISRTNSYQLLALEKQLKIKDLIINGKNTYIEKNIKQGKTKGYCPEHLLPSKHKKQIKLLKKNEQSYQQKMLYQYPNLQQVNKLQYPYSTIGLLKSIFQQSTLTKTETIVTFGTAFLVGPNLLLTSAHNIYNHTSNFKKGKQFYFYPSDKTTNIQKVIPYKIKQQPYFPTQYQQKNRNSTQKLRYDYAFLQLYENIGIHYGWLGLNLNPVQQKIIDQEVSIYGYPEIMQGGGGNYLRDRNNLVESNCVSNYIGQNKLNFKLCGMTGTVCEYDGKTLSYKISTRNGQSGSPILYNNQKQIYVIGIHCQSGNKNQQFNKGFLIAQKNILSKIIQNNLCYSMKEFQINIGDLEEQISHELIGNIIRKEIPQIINQIFLGIIRLQSCYIGKDGMKMLVDAKLPFLKKLNLRNNSIGKEGAEILAKGNWPQLIDLKIGTNYIQAQGAQHLSKGNWKNLNMLYIQSNTIGSQGIQYLIKAEWPLEFLNLEDNKINIYDGKLVVGRFEKLKRLLIKNNGLQTRQILEITRNRNIQID